MADGPSWPASAAIFGASGGIGSALTIALAERGTAPIYAGSRSGIIPNHPAIRPFTFDLTDEASIANAGRQMAPDPPQLVIVATGVLTLAGGQGPERSYRGIDPAAMAQAYAVNTIGPALIAKHILPLFSREGRNVLVALSAKVGSITDNRVGGWHSYRASKAALNMCVKNWAIELGRTHRKAIVAALHPGTVDTGLSQPFQKNLPKGQLTAPHEAAANLLNVIHNLTLADSGALIAWDDEHLPG